MKNKLKSILALSLFSVVGAYAQTGDVGIGTTTPDASAALDITSVTKGLLMPRLTTTERNAIVLPAKGLTIYNTTSNQIEFNSGTTATPVWTSSNDSGWTQTNGIASYLQNQKNTYLVDNDTLMTKNKFGGLDINKFSGNADLGTLYQFNGKKDNPSVGAGWTQLGVNGYNNAGIIGRASISTNGTWPNPTYGAVTPNMQIGADVADVYHDTDGDGTETLKRVSFFVTKIGTVNNTDDTKVSGVYNMHLANANGDFTNPVLSLNGANSNMGMGTETPDASALIDLTSTSKGLLLPRMNTTQRDAILTPANGLTIFNTTTNQLEFNSGTTTTPVWSAVQGTTTNLYTNNGTLTGNRVVNGGGNFMIFNNLNFLRNSSNGVDLDIFNTASAAFISNVTTGAKLILRTQGTDRLNIEANGNVGVGALSASTQLHVRAGASGAAGGLKVSPSADTTDGIQLYVNGTNNETGIIENVWDTSSYSNLALNPNGGNVGIGTTTPNAGLQIKATTPGDTFNRSISSYLPSSAVYNTGGTFGEFANMVSGFDFNWYADKWTIGATRGTTTDVGDFIFARNGSSVMKLAVNGNLGLGTTTPTSKLQVVGLPVYVDNAAAITAGLTAGAFYHAGDGLVRVVF